MERIGDAIRAERNRRRIPQKAMAAALGRSPSWLCAIERGQRIPAPRTLSRIAVLLAITPEDLVRAGNGK